MFKLSDLSTFGQVLLAIVVIMIVETAAVVTVFAIRPDHDNSGILTTLVTSGGTTVVALLALLKGIQNSQDIAKNTQITTQAAVAAQEVRQDVKAVKEDAAQVAGK